VIARGGGDHACRALLGGERAQLVEHAAWLEGAAALEEFGLEEDAGAERGRAEDRGAVEVASDRLARGADIVDSDQRRCPVSGTGHD
jgi:hypothetical protein